MNALEVEIHGFDDFKKLLKTLKEETARKVTRFGLRKAGEAALNYLLINLSGKIVNEKTGRLVAAFEGQKPKLRYDRFGVYGGFFLPTRAALGIRAYKSGAKDAGYYPTALEFGTKGKHRIQRERLGKRLEKPVDLGPLEAFAPMRRAINDHRSTLDSILMTETVKQLKREYKKEARKQGLEGQTT